MNLNLLLRIMQQCFTGFLWVSSAGWAEMGSGSSSYAPKTIYVDVEGKAQKVACVFNHISRDI